jgi:WD domain, G-beta repeat/MTH538 TIR-like domain (DUF1863)
MATVPSYDAFISYSHQHDRTLGPALQASLERFAKPWRKLRMSRIFIDKANLAASPELWGSVEEGLASSRWFILLASADAAGSVWVDREVRWWREHRSLDRLLIVATSPGMTWEKAAGDWSAAAPVPPSLRDAFSAEPFWIDLSDLPPGVRASQIPADQVAAIAAPVRDVPKDTLVGENLREHRRTMRLARGAIAVLAVLTVLAVTASVIAIQDARAANTAAAAAVSGQLAAQTEVVDATDPVQAAELAEASWRLAPTARARALARVSLLDVLGQPDRGAIATPGDLVSTPYHSVVFSPDGKKLATASGDGTVRLWDVSTHRQVGTPMTANGKPVTAVAFNPDGTMLATASADGIVRLWDVATHRQLGTPMTADRDCVYDLAFSPDGQILATAGADGTVRLWDVATHQRIGASIDLHAAVHTVAFSPDGQILATGSDDGTARLWDVATHRQIGAPMTADDDYVRDVAFSPDGKILATASNDGTARLWDVATQQEIGAPMTADSDYVKGVAFSPDGTILATTSDDGRARLWDVATQQQIGPPMTPADTSLARVAFSPEGTILATSGGGAADGDDSAQLWDVAFPRDLIGAVCAIAGDISLTRAQWAADVPSEPFEQTCP